MLQSCTTPRCIAVRSRVTSAAAAPESCARTSPPLANQSATPTIQPPRLLENKESICFSHACLKSHICVFIFTFIIYFRVYKVRYRTSHVTFVTRLAPRTSLQRSLSRQYQRSPHYGTRLVLYRPNQAPLATRMLPNDTPDNQRDFFQCPFQCPSLCPLRFLSLGQSLRDEHLIFTDHRIIGSSDPHRSSRRPIS